MGLADCACVSGAEELGGIVAGDAKGVGRWDGGDIFGGESPTRKLVVHGMLVGYSSGSE